MLIKFTLSHARSLTHIMVERETHIVVDNCRRRAATWNDNIRGRTRTSPPHITCIIRRTLYGNYLINCCWTFSHLLCVRFVWAPGNGRFMLFLSCARLIHADFVAFAAPHAASKIVGQLYAFFVYVLRMLSRICAVHARLKVITQE